MPRADPNWIYGVHRGMRPGIYSSWARCQPLVKNFAGAVYKKFPKSDREAAQFFVDHGREITDAERGGDKQETTSLPTMLNRTEYMRAAPSTTGFTGSINDDAQALLATIDAPGGGMSSIWFAEKDRRNIAESFPLPMPTANRCRLYAVQRLLERINDDPETYGVAAPDQEVIVCCTSRYVVNALTRWWHDWEKTNWNNEAVKNRRLIEHVLALQKSRPVSYCFIPEMNGPAQNEPEEDAEEDPWMFVQPPRV